MLLITVICEAFLYSQIDLLQQFEAFAQVYVTFCFQLAVLVLCLVSCYYNNVASSDCDLTVCVLNSYEAFLR